MSVATSMSDDDSNIFESKTIASNPDSEAIASFERDIRLNPNNANAYLNRGIAYRSRGEYEQALSDFDRVIELDPSNAEAYTNREKVLTELGRNVEVSTANEQAAPISSQPAGVQVQEKSQAAEENLDVVSQGEPEPIGITVRALADTYSENDLLQFSDYADALVDFISSKETQKPLTIAIDASWGMGKTTLMRLIERKLKGQTDNEKQGSASSRVKPNGKEQGTDVKPSFPLVWFNAWQYDQEDSLLAALVMEILDQVRKSYTLQQKVGFWWDLTQRRLGKRNRIFQVLFRVLPFILGLLVLASVLFAIAWFWRGNLLVSWIKTVTLPIAGAIGVVALFYASAKDLYVRFIKPYDQKIARLYQKFAQYVREPNYKERLGFLAQFKKDFSAIVEVATSGGKWPLIIFIDDLDRCSPPKPVEIIEAINLLLDAQYCVFVIGMDMRTVAGSIEAKYKDLLTYLGPTDAPGELTLGYRFLEKIIQIAFHLPRADTMMVQSFIDALLKGPNENQETSREQVLEVAQLIEAEQRGRKGKQLDEAANTVRQARPDISESTLVQAKEEIRAKSFDDSQVVQDVIRQVAPYLELNPRKIKRFINLFRLQALIANRRGLLETGVVKLDVLARWIVITSRWPSIVDALLAGKDFIKRLREARSVVDTMKQERLKAQQERTSDNRKAYEEFETVDVKFYQSKLDTYTSDAHIKLLIDATALLQLLSEMNDADVEAWPIYLHLAQATSQSA